MKLIEDLGVTLDSANTPRYFGLYECPICKEQFIREHRHMNVSQESLCHSCANALKSRTRAVEASSRFIAEANKIHGGKYDYSLVVYRTKKIKILIICPEHGVFAQRPNNHKSGQGCPACANNGFDKTKSALLYYLKITYNNVVAYKIGITNRTVRERFNTTDLEKITVLKTWDFHLGADALAKEQEIIKLYRESRYLGEPLLSSGNTELFTFDVLGIDQFRSDQSPCTEDPQESASR